MRLPFTVEQFLDTFRQYNEAIWPAQWLLWLLGVAAVVMAFRASPRVVQGVLGILAVLWTWMGVVYHLMFFRAINPIAGVFGVLFIAQGVLFAWLGLRRGRMRLAVRADARGIAGVLLVVYGLLIYPAAAYLLGHRYPAMATFGLPCPTTILTLGLVLWFDPPVPRAALIVPLVWAAIGASAAINLGILEDLGLVAAGLVVVALPAVLDAIRSIIEKSRRLGLTSSICGQAPSVHPEYAERLVRWGIDSISVNPDVIERTRHNVAAAERGIILEAARSSLKQPQD